MNGCIQSAYKITTSIINPNFEKSMKDKSLLEFINRTRFEGCCFNMIIGVMNSNGELYRIINLISLDAYIAITDYMLLLGFKDITLKVESRGYDAIFIQV